MKSLDLSNSPKEIMHHYGKSFYFASVVFSQKTAIKVFSLYQFCRYVDDCGDELDPNEAHKKLDALNDIIDGKLSEPKSLRTLVDGIVLSGVKHEDLKTLISGALFEAQGGSVKSKKDLIYYCYLVAGVVGKMMCPLIGVKHKKAQPYAIDLGIGMQITNICRDVLEDHKNQRHYLWELRSNKEALDTKENLAIVLKHLDLADLYYKSAFNGLSYIPFRSRVAIFIASEIYRAIGVKIRRIGGSRVFHQRVSLSSLEKFWVCLKNSFKLMHLNFWRPKAHNSHLHNELNQALTAHGLKN